MILKYFYWICRFHIRITIFKVNYYLYALKLHEHYEFGYSYDMFALYSMLMTTLELNISTPNGSPNINNKYIKTMCLSLIQWYINFILQYN